MTKGVAGDINETARGVSFHLWREGRQPADIQQCENTDVTDADRLLVIVSVSSEMRSGGNNDVKVTSTPGSTPALAHALAFERHLNRLR